MNKRITELRFQAWDYVASCDDQYSKSATDLFEEKLAELIVKECMAIGFHTVYKVDDDNAAVAVYQNIKEHFGVE